MATRPNTESKPTDTSDAGQPATSGAVSTGTAIETPDTAQAVASDDEKAQAEAEAAAADAANPNKGNSVLYLGPRNIVAAGDELKSRALQLGEGTRAEITPTDWKLAGIAASRNFVWDISNNWQIPATHFSAEQLDYLLTASNRFELVNGEGVKVER